MLVSGLLDELGPAIAEVEPGLTSFGPYVLYKQEDGSEVMMRENIKIDILSRDNGARDKRWEVFASLQSIYSQQKQEEYQFKIFKLPTSFVNATEAEGGSQLNRFSIVIPTFSWYSKEVDLPTDQDYYDKFETRVDDEQSIGGPEGIIEFQEGGI